MTKEHCFIKHDQWDIEILYKMFHVNCGALVR